MADVDAELAEQEAVLAEADGAEPTDADHPMHDDDADAGDDDDGHPRRRRGGASRGAAGGAADGAADGADETTPQKHPIAGNRKIIRRTLEPDGTAAAAGIDLLSPEELAKREARAAKFAPSEEQLATSAARDSVSKRREERMKKFGMDAPEPEAPPPAPALKPSPAILLLSKEEADLLEARARKFEMAAPDPLDVVERRAASAVHKGYWERRRTALPAETPRLESVYVYGVDKLSTNELLLLFHAHSPQWVEWINDSSANVVFADGAAAAAALEASTEPLWAPTVDACLMDDGAAGPDGGAREPQAVRAMQAWRTLPEALAHAGKGLQLLFRLASEQDVKPETRRPSRWYGETEHKRGRPRAQKYTAKRPPAKRAASAPPPSQLVVSLGADGADDGAAEPPPDLRKRLGGKRAEREPDGADDATAADAMTDEVTAANMASDGGEPAEAARPAAKRRATMGAGTGAGGGGGSVRGRLGARKGSPAASAAAAEPASGVVDASMMAEPTAAHENDQSAEDGQPEAPVGIASAVDA